MPLFTLANLSLACADPFDALTCSIARTAPAGATLLDECGRVLATKRRVDYGDGWILRWVVEASEGAQGADSGAGAPGAEGEQP